MTPPAPRRQGDEPGQLTPPASFGGGGLPPLPAPAQTGTAAGWIAWHAVELAGVGVPVALAIAVSMWFAVIAIPAAGLWAAHELRSRRPDRQLALPAPANGENTGE